MREIRQSGSEGGGFEFNRFPLPLSRQCARTYVVLYRAVAGAQWRIKKPGQVVRPYNASPWKATGPEAAEAGRAAPLASKSDFRTPVESAGLQKPEMPAPRGGRVEAGRAARLLVRDKGSAMSESLPFWLALTRIEGL